MGYRGQIRYLYFFHYYVSSLSRLFDRQGQIYCTYLPSVNGKLGFLNMLGPGNEACGVIGRVISRELDLLGWNCCYKYCWQGGDGPAFSHGSGLIGMELLLQLLPALGNCLWGVPGCMGVLCQLEDPD